MKRIICPRCKAIYRNASDERCPVCRGELVTPQMWNDMRISIQSEPKGELAQKSPPVAGWRLKFLLGIIIGCAAFAIIVFLAKM